MTFWNIISSSIRRGFYGQQTLLHRIGAGRQAIEIHERNGNRWLQFGDGAIQSRINLDAPSELALPYTVGMAAPLLFRPRFNHILMMGLGGGSLLRFYHQLLPDCQFTVLEQSSAMVSVARRYFEAPMNDERVTVRIGDVRDLIDAQAGQHDLAILDVFDDRGLPAWVLQSEFCGQCHACLTPDGVLLANIWVAPGTGQAAATSNLRAQFEQRCLSFHPAESTNLVVLGFRALTTPLSLKCATARAARLREQAAVDAPDVLARITASNAEATLVLGP